MWRKMINVWAILLSGKINKINSPTIIYYGISIVIAVGIGVLIWTLYTYLHHERLLGEIMAYKWTLEEEPESISKDDINAYNRNKIRIQKSKYTDEIPISELMGDTFMYWVVGVGLALVFTIIMLMLYLIGTILTLALHNVIPQIPHDIVLTMIGLIIPLRMGLKRSKPQWLKALLVMSEVSLVLLLIIELAFYL